MPDLRFESAPLNCEHLTGTIVHDDTNFTTLLAAPSASHFIRLHGFLVFCDASSGAVTFKDTSNTVHETSGVDAGASTPTIELPFGDNYQFRDFTAAEALLGLWNATDATSSLTYHLYYQIVHT